MVGPLEEEQQCVAPELEQTAAAVRGDLQDGPEDPVERVDELLGPSPAATFQTLGQRGEARHVGEAQRALDDAGAGLRVLRHPHQSDVGDVEPQARHDPDLVRGPRAVARLGPAAPVHSSSQYVRYM